MRFLAFPDLEGCASVCLPRSILVVIRIVRFLCFAILVWPFAFGGFITGFGDTPRIPELLLKLVNVLSSEFFLCLTFLMLDMNSISPVPFPFAPLVLTFLRISGELLWICGFSILEMLSLDLV